MRFGDGAWRVLDDVTPSYLARVDAVDVTERSVVLHVSSRLEAEHSAPLQGRAFTVELTSPAENVFRVRTRHHLGRRVTGPHFALAAEPQRFSARSEAERLTLRSGDLMLTIDEHPWAIRFADAASGAPLTASPYRAQALMKEAGAGTSLREQLTLGVGEQVYGLGERFQAFTRNGQSVNMWNADCGTRSDKGYKNVPFYLTSKGYGVFVNSSARVSFEIGTAQVTRAQFAVPGGELDYIFILGPSPKQVLARLGALTGRPALPPAWSFGSWLATASTAQCDEQAVQSMIDGMAERQIPLHALHLGAFWMTPHHWCNFRWNQAAFPDPEGLLARLHRRGLQVCVWLGPCIAERSHLFEEGRRHHYLVERPNGDVWQRDGWRGDGWQPGVGYVDFTNPAATRWFQAELRKLLRMGVDCFKTDFGEDIPTDVVYFDGSDPERMHNHYAYLYNQAVFEVLELERGKGDACVFARSATATCQRLPVHCSGDGDGNYESMAEQLRGGLSLGLSGFGFWSHDIGGVEGKPSAAVYKRWVAFGLLSSHSRLHGSASDRVPWLYDDEACDVLRHFTNLKCRLMPYLMATAAQARDSSQPMLRAMLLEFPDDPACRMLDRQYLLGDSLLVAPVFHDSRAEYYLPRGSWTHLLTGESREGGRWCFDDLDFFGLPLWVRQNALVCVGSSGTQVDYDLSRGLRILCGSLEGRVALEASVLDTHGEAAGTLQVYHDRRRVRVTSPTLSDFQVHLPWAPTVVEVERGSIVKDDARAPITTRGVVVRADSGTASFSYGGVRD